MVGWLGGRQELKLGIARCSTLVEKYKNRIGLHQKAMCCPNLNRMEGSSPVVLGP